MPIHRATGKMTGVLGNKIISPSAHALGLLLYCFRGVDKQIIGMHACSHP